MSDKKYKQFETCSNTNCIHLKNRIFLYEDEAEEFSSLAESLCGSLQRRYEVLEFPSKETEKQYITIKKLKKL